jgi:glucosamine-6-phosphate deaminase
MRHPLNIYSRGEPMPSEALSSSFRAGNLVVRVAESREAMGQAAAADAATRIRALANKHEALPIIFATGESQLATLRALTAMADLPWSRIVGFHMDEYIGLPENHPASFRHYLRENLTGRVPLSRFYGIETTNGDPRNTCREYADLLHIHQPLLCLLGIGENGHLAFNDPAEADFNDPEEVKVVSLDETCRQQQVNEGWFQSLTDVPGQAVTLTIPTLLRVPTLILSVPGPRKALIVKRTLEEAISTRCPSTILRTHPDATAFLDRESAAQILL